MRQVVGRLPAKKGTAGFDGLTVGDIAYYLKQHWQAIREETSMDELAP